jgi:hypothetical protein
MLNPNCIGNHQDKEKLSQVILIQKLINDEYEVQTMSFNRLQPKTLNPKPNNIKLQSNHKNLINTHKIMRKTLAAIRSTFVFKCHFPL